MRSLSKSPLSVAREALAAARKALPTYQKLANDNPTPYNQFLLIGIHDFIGGTLSNMGKPAEALEVRRQTLAITQKLVDNDPANTDFQSFLAWSHDSIGWTFLNMGKPIESVEASRKALPIYQKLVDDNPANTGFQLSLANSQTNIGRGLARQKRLAEAFTALEKGLAIRQKLARAEPNHPDYGRALAESLAVRGGVRVRAGQPAEAAELRRALELWAKFFPHGDLAAQLDRSRALALLAGLGTDAKSGVTKEEAKTFADQSVAALADIVKTGWALPSELKVPDFDAVRDRPDFQKLVAEVEAKAEKVPATAPPPRENK